MSAPKDTDVLMIQGAIDNVQQRLERVERSDERIVEAVDRMRDALHAREVADARVGGRIEEAIKGLEREVSGVREATNRNAAAASKNAEAITAQGQRLSALENRRDNKTPRSGTKASDTDDLKRRRDIEKWFKIGAAIIGAAMAIGGAIAGAIKASG